MGWDLSLVEQSASHVKFLVNKGERKVGRDEYEVKFLVAHGNKMMS